MLLLNEEHVRESCEIYKAIEINKNAFIALEDGLMDVPSRIILPVQSGATLFKPCHMINGNGLGLKVVSVRPENAQKGLATTPGTISLFDKVTGVQSCLMGATYLTGIRTAAGSAVATNILAKKNCQKLVVFGAGLQAESHILCMLCVRPMVSKVVIVSRTRERTFKMIDGLKERLSQMKLNSNGEMLTTLPAFHVGTVEDCLDADIICCTTSSSVPLFELKDLNETVHINAVGSFRPDTAEVSAQVVAACETIIIDTPEALDVGDIAPALQNQQINRESIQTLGHLLKSNSNEKYRRTLFKSVGTAAQDISTAQYVLEECERRGIGQTFALQ